MLGPVAGFCDGREVRASVRRSGGWEELPRGLTVYGLAFVSGCALAASPSGPWMPWAENDLEDGLLPHVLRFNC